MTAHRAYTHLKNENNIGVYNKLYKEYWTQKTGGCAYCKPHRWENAGRVPRRSWKLKRKTKYRRVVDL